MKEDKTLSDSKSYRGLLECPFKSGFIEFDFHRTDRISELLESIEKRWGTSYGWATPEGFADRYSKKVYGYVEGWIVAVEDESGAYVALQRDDLIPIKTPVSKEAEDLSTKDDWYPGAIEHGCYNYESFGRPQAPFRIPFRRTYETPDKNRFDVCLIALVLVNGG